MSALRNTIVPLWFSFLTNLSSFLVEIAVLASTTHKMIICSKEQGLSNTILFLSKFLSHSIDRYPGLQNQSPQTAEYRTHNVRL